MWHNILSLAKLLARVCGLGDPVTVRFFLAHATRTFGPHEVVDCREFKLPGPPDELTLAHIQEAIVQIVEDEYLGRFPDYADLRIFQVTAEGGLSELLRAAVEGKPFAKEKRFTERLGREDAILLMEESPITVSQSNIIDIAAIYVDHLVPQIPPGVNLAQRERERSIDRAKWAPAPSDISKDVNGLRTAFNDHLVLMGRPLDVTAPDPSIFSPPLAYLSQALNQPQADPDGETLDTVTKLFSVSAVVYDNEDARSQAVTPILEQLFGVHLVPQFEVSFDSESEERRRTPHRKRKRRRRNPKGPPGARADAVMVTTIRQGVDARPVILELKKELGMVGVGDVQVAMTHMKIIVHPISAFVRENTPCPTILLTLSGTFLHLAYGILVDTFISKPIDQHWFPLGGATPKQQRANIQNLARVVSAVRDGIEGLQTFYKGLSSTATRPPPYLPNPTLVDPSNTWFHDLKFSDRLSRDTSRSLFRASLLDRSVLVKFCDDYGAQAHVRLAGVALAPELHHVEPLVGGLTMVVMEFHPEMMSAYDKYFGRGLPESVITEVDRALDILHASVPGLQVRPLVHGDICRENILVPRNPAADTPIQLVGFRWSGEVGQAHYPCNSFLDNVRGTLEGRRGNGDITIDHDTRMRGSMLAPYA